ncbi:MAG TPA: HAD family hydrolase [Ohtaekwangia sp.]|uniref:D-glycero-alpha-D-manno-heptose-1,7-bisphosphate 7-phosphatase n=1 Tax=Ohtaekwangia sp. TaxID=2066019 RepID=UPI002F9512BB
MNKAVFIDKDGTLIEDIPYNVNPERIVLCEGARESLARLKEQGYLLIVISNQAGVAHGYFQLQDLQQVKERLFLLLKELDGFYFCPHHPAGVVQAYSIACYCRKPEPGMILQAARDFKVELSRSWMIGDILTDVEAGNKAGCRTILVNNGNETEWNIQEERRPTYIVKNLREASQRILKEEWQIQE